MSDKTGRYPKPKPVVAIDFDDVLYAHTSPFTYAWETPNPPVDGARQAVYEYIANGFEVVVHSARANDKRGMHAIHQWLGEHDFPKLMVTAQKIHAAVYIDDKAFRFEGMFPSAAWIKASKSWDRVEGPHPATVDDVNSPPRLEFLAMAHAWLKEKQEAGALGGRSVEYWFLALADELSREARYQQLVGKSAYYHPEYAPEGKPALTCDTCGARGHCEYAGDLYNTDGDCLASK